MTSNLRQLANWRILPAVLLLLTGSLWQAERASAEGSALAYTLTGEGDLTLVFEAGFGQPAATWDALLTELDGEFRTLTYSRAGIGASPAPDHTLTIEEHVADLEALLASVNIGSDLVLVGHSYGGLLMTEFARKHADQVTALVLVDPSIREQRSIAREVDADRVAADDAMLMSMIPPTMQLEYQSLINQMDEAPSTVTPLASDLPVLLFTSTFRYDDPFVFEETEAGRELWLKGHTELIRESRMAVHMRMPDADHNVHIDQPGRVARAISEFLSWLN